MRLQNSRRERVTDLQTGNLHDAEEVPRGGLRALDQNVESLKKTVAGRAPAARCAPSESSACGPTRSAASCTAGRSRGQRALKGVCVCVSALSAAMSPSPKQKPRGRGGERRAPPSAHAVATRSHCWPSRRRHSRGAQKQ